MSRSWQEMFLLLLKNTFMFIGEQENKSYDVYVVLLIFVFNEQKQHNDENRVSLLIIVCMNIVSEEFLFFKDFRQQSEKHSKQGAPPPLWLRPPATGMQVTTGSDASDATLNS